MSYSRPEQICPRESRGYRKFLKLKAKKKRRQSERRNIENAPKKTAYHGYSL